MKNENKDIQLVVFLDRDGVINKFPGRGEYVKNWKEFEFLPGVFEALKALKEKGAKIFIISNQAGVGKGIYSQKDLELITENMLKELRSEGIELDGVFYCTHSPEENCECRKPKTRLLERAVQSLGEVKILRKIFIGDSIRDIKTARNFGCIGILVLSGQESLENKSQWEIEPDFVFKDLKAAVNFILNSFFD